MYRERSFVLCMDAQECDFIKSPALSQLNSSNEQKNRLEMELLSLDRFLLRRLLVKKAEGRPHLILPPSPLSVTNSVKEWNQAVLPTEQDSLQAKGARDNSTLTSDIEKYRFQWPLRALPGSGVVQDQIIVERTQFVVTEGEFL